MPSSKALITDPVRLKDLFFILHWLTIFPVYAAFRATVHIIDHAKKATLGRLLAESVNSTAPGETLDEKLAALTFPRSEDCKCGILKGIQADLNHNTTVPPPSSETEAWWDTPGKLLFLL